MNDLLERMKNHTFKGFTIFKGVIEGGIEGFKQRNCIMDKIHWNSFYLSMYKHLLGDATNAILKKIGEDYGKEIFAMIQEKFRVDTNTVFLFILQNLEKLGWGAFRNAKIDTDRKEITVELHNSNEAYNAEIPSCYHVKGILRGIGKSVLGDNIVVREIECIAKGDKICKFILGDKSIVPDLFDQDTIAKLIKILQELKRTIKSSVELIATTDGRPIISNLSEEIDSVLWTTIISVVLAGGKKSSKYIDNDNLKEIIINAEKGTIIASLVKEDILIAVTVGPDTSPGLAGLAVKKAKDQIIDLLK
ncbi:MAG: V4R domain-containing protein [Promethearchaeota archaeon]